MNTRRTGIGPAPELPDRPIYGATRDRRSLARAAIVKARSVFTPDRNEHDLASQYSRDEALVEILKGSVNVATPANSVALLESVAHAALIGAIGGGAPLLQRSGLMLTFGRRSLITLPVLNVAPSQFTPPGGAIPVVNGAVTVPATLTPKAIKAIWVSTRELLESGNAEAVTNEAMSRAIGLGLDAILFGAGAGDETTPQGLLHNVTPIGASTETDSYTAMVSDIGALVGAVSVVGGPIALIVNTARALMMPLMSRGGMMPTILASPVIDVDSVTAVATDGLASALSPAIDIASSREAAVHMDTAPTGISTPGSPATIASPVRTIYQTDSIATRLILVADWAVRHASTVAVVNGVTW